MTDLRHECAWWALLPAPPAPRRLSGDIKADAVVIGAGFTGLACARRLAELEPHADIAIVEADGVGRTNSGRNSGFLLDVSFYDAAGGALQAARTRLQTAGLAWLRKIVERHGIACDWKPWGNLYAAVSDADEAAMEPLARRYREQGRAVEEWPADRIRALTRSNAFRHAFFSPGTALVQPVKLVRGLAAALPENCTLFEESAVRSLKRVAGRHEVRTQDGCISTGRVFVCANGGAPALGIGRSRIVPVSTFAAVTPPLDAIDEGFRDAEPFGMLPSLSGAATIRLTDERRLLIRQGGAFTPGREPTPAQTERFFKLARATMAERWPHLLDVGFEYVWSGIMSLTRNTGQVFGALGDGLYAAVICNGAGNTLGTSSGRVLAELSHGIESDLLAAQHAVPPPAWVPPDLLLAPFVQFEIARSERALRS